MPRGGPRPNSGGKRLGAGRKRKILPPLPESPSGCTPLEFLLGTMRDPKADPRIRLEAAKAAAPFVHIKKGEGGKKEAKERAAKVAGQGKFAPAAPPLKLVR